MRTALLTSSLLLFPFTVSVAANKPLHPLDKMVIVALTADRTRGADIETAVRRSLVEHGVKAESIRTIFSTPPSVDEILAKIRADGYDHLLCLAPRKTIQLQNNTDASMKACLTAFATGTYPSGEPLATTLPYGEREDRQERSSGDNAAMLRGPMATNPGAAPVSVTKGVLRMYDIETGAREWEKRGQAKYPADLRTEYQSKLIAAEVWDIIHNSGILPKK